MPYINQEDLVNSKSLLVFINSRARNEPSLFAHAELQNAPLGSF
jgi:hypothetical protein